MCTCSKPLTFHNGFMFFASRSCFKHFCRFQALRARTGREEIVKNKIWATTTHVECVVPDQEGHRKATGQYICHLVPIILSKNKACDCYCHLILIDLSKKLRIVFVLVILFVIAASIKLHLFVSIAAGTVIVLPKDDRPDSVQEERLGLPYWTMIFGHFCRGRRIQMSGHFDFGTLNNVSASSILTWV